MTRWILVVEDEAPLATMLCDNLQLDGHGTQWAADGELALAELAARRFDLVILDVMLPGRNGLAVLRTMRGRGDDTPVLMLSAKGTDDDRIRGLELAADDYLAKPFHLRELLLRVSALLRRAAVPAPATDRLRIGGNSIDFRGQRLSSWRGEEHALSATQTRLLRLLASHCGGVVARREVVERLFGPATPVTARTVDNLVAELRRRLEPDRTAPRYLQTVRGIGWRLRLDDDSG